MADHLIDLSDPAVVVVPDGLEETPEGQRLADACGAPLLPHGGFDEALFRDHHVIACGHMADNAAVTRLYNARRCIADTLFPGGDNYLLTSLRDPLGHGRNAVVAGASGEAGLAATVEELTRLVEASGGRLGRVSARRLPGLPEPPADSEIEELVQRDLALWDGGWVASPFRGGRLQSWLWNHYLSGRETWGRLAAPVFCGSLEPWREQRLRHPEEYHDFFHLDQLIHLWELVEDDPVYQPAERQAVVEMFVELLRHLAGLFYLREEVNPDGLPRQNHVTFIGLNLAAGHDYLSRRHGITEFAAAARRVERIFEGQASGYKPNDDAGVGYVWLTPRHTNDYLLARGDYRFVDGGPVADLCRLAAVTTDNLRSEVGYGDSSGFSAFERGGWRLHLWPLLASLWRTRDPGHLWLLNWLGEGKRPNLNHGMESWRASVEATEEGFTLEGVEPRLPEELLGVTALDLPESARRWVEASVPEGYRPDPGGRYFDKLSLRAGFAPGDEYALLEGVGTFCHGHEDTNAILRLTWRNRAWLADGDYIRAAPRFHNSVTVLRDGAGVLDPPGDGVVIPPLARLTIERDEGDLGIVQSEAAGYDGLDWRRSLVWRKGRCLAVVDELLCREPGDYRCRCLWRVVGEVDGGPGRLRLRQGDEELFLLCADDSEAEIVEDPGGPWGGYPHHRGPLHVVHRKVHRRLRAGDSILFLHVFTPHDGIEVESPDPGALRIRDGAEQVTVTLEDGRPVVETGTTPATAASTRPADPPEAPAPVREFRVAPPRWERRLEAGALGPVAAAVSREAPHLLAGGDSGDVVKLDAGSGDEVWRVRLDSPASSLLWADIDADGAPEALVGSAASELIVLDGGSGRERWRRPLKNLYGSVSPVTALAVADLEGGGETSVLAGTAGWFVNVFTPGGSPKWARWVRYHVITALEADDVDGDGRAEVIVGTTYSTPLTVHDYDGAFRWSTLEQVGSEGNATTPRRGIHLTRMRLSDLDGDGVREIVYGTEDGWLFAVEPRAGAELWQLNIVGEVMALEVLPGGVVAASGFGDLYGLDPDGTLRRHSHPCEWVRASTRLEDDLVLAAEGGRLLRVNADAEVTGELWTGGEVRRLTAAGRHLVCVLDDGRMAAHSFG